MAAEGYVMLSADYCQMELRMMAEASCDAGLCAMLRDPGQDPFRSLAARWKNVRPWQVCRNDGSAYQKVLIRSATLTIAT